MFTPTIPLTGLGGFAFLEKTEDSQREALSNDAEISREVSYFQENIVNVRSSDDLLADRRLLEMALTAYGLETEIDKKALIKQVLDEGVEDENAMANRMQDKRWTSFAKDFGFGSSTAGLEISAFQAAVELRFRDDPPVADTRPINDAEIATFRNKIGSITSVDTLLEDRTALKVAVAAFGLDGSDYTDQHYRDLLASDLTDSTSYANTVEDGAWATFAAAFDGLENSAVVTEKTELRMVIEREYARRFTFFTADSLSDLTDNKLSEAERDSAMATIDAATSATDLANDDAVREALRVAFGLTDSTLDAATEKQLYLDAIAGDFTAANAQSHSGWLAAAKALAAFTDSGGTVQKVSHAEYAVELELGARRFETLPYLDTETPKPSVDAEELAYFQATMTPDMTAAAFTADERLLEVALTAFGLETEGKSAAFVQSILEEDPSSSTALVNYLSNPAWKEFAEAFRPSTQPGGGPEVWRYRLEDQLEALNAPNEDIVYLRKNWNLISSNLDLVLDEKLMDIVLSAFELPKDSYSSSFVLNAIASDTANPVSFVNVIGDERWVGFADMFGSGAGGGGNTRLSGFGEQVTDLYEAYTFEVAVGLQDQDLRLALNFRRQIDEIANSASVATAGWLQVMGDEPMRQVMDAALGLPTETAQLDLEVQQEIYADKAQSIFGASDASVFADADTVSYALERFFLSRLASSAPSLSTPGYNAIAGLETAAANARLFNEQA